MTTGQFEWFEDEEFWRATIDQMFPQWRLDNAPREVEDLLALTGMGSGRVLDLCCGPGRHSRALARHGFSVVGVDRTGYLLDIARERAAAENLDVKFVQADMRDFEVGDDFDLAINLFTSFGYMDDYDENSRVLHRLFACLKPGGRLVMDLRSKDGLAGAMPQARLERLGSGGYLAQGHWVEGDRRRMRTVWLYLDQGRYKEYELTHYLYSGRELHDLLRAAGFFRVDLYGDLSGAPYHDDSPRLVAMASK